jgi:hypothetical protein
LVEIAVTSKNQNENPKKMLRDADRIGVLVLGMHRSGTSAVTRVLNLVGCDLPATLMGANSSNEAGHWESTPICRLNDRILESAGSDWQDWRAINSEWWQSSKSKKFRQEAIALLSSEFGESRLFVLKDPRICRLMPFWVETLQEAGIKPVAILPQRNPLEVAYSLRARNGFDAPFGHMLWLRHVLEAELGSRDVPRFFCDYTQVLSDWVSIINQCREALSIRFPKANSEASDEVAAFLRGNLRHHEQKAESVLANPILSAWLRDTFRIMDNWSRTQVKKDDYALLDRIRIEFNAAAPLFHPVVAAAHIAGAQLKQSADLLARTESEVNKYRAENEKLREEVAATRASAADLEKRLAERFKEIAMLSNILKTSESTARQKARQEIGELKKVVAALIEDENWRYLPRSLRVKRKIELLARSGLFDGEWYLQFYRDVSESGIDPLRHFVEFGAGEGRSPNPRLAGILDAQPLSGPFLKN